MPERMIRIRLPFRVYMWLEELAQELNLEDGSEELTEELLIEFHRRHAPRKRRRPRPSAPAG